MPAEERLIWADRSSMPLTEIRSWCLSTSSASRRIVRRRRLASSIALEKCCYECTGKKKGHFVSSFFWGDILGTFQGQNVFSLKSMNMSLICPLYVPYMSFMDIMSLDLSYFVIIWKHLGHFVLVMSLYLAANITQGHYALKLICSNTDLI